MRHIINKSEWQTASAVCLLALVMSSTAVGRANGEGAISQDFESTTNNIAAGALLSLVTTGQNQVVPASSNNVRNLVGVVGTEPIIEISNSNKDNTQVVVSGAAEALISNINGNVSAGDKITASPIAGIGMKASNPAEVVGTAQAGLNSVKTTEQTVTNKDGKNVSIKVGLVPLEVNVSYYNATRSQQTTSSVLPQFMQKLANQLSGKQVSPLRVLIGALAILIGFITAGVMLYTSIRSKIVSIGRNPLAQEALRRGFIDVVVAAIGVMIIAVAATYLIIVV